MIKKLVCITCHVGAKLAYFFQLQNFFKIIFSFLTKKTSQNKFFHQLPSPNASGDGKNANLR